MRCEAIARIAVRLGLSYEGTIVLATVWRDDAAIAHASSVIA